MDFKLLKEKNLKVYSMLPAPGGVPGINPSSPLKKENLRLNIIRKLSVLHEWECTTVMWIAGWGVFGTSLQEAWNYSLEGLIEVAKYAKYLGVTLVVEPTPADSNGLGYKRK